MVFPHIYEIHATSYKVTGEGRQSAETIASKGLCKKEEGKDYPIMVKLILSHRIFSKNDNKI